MRRKARPRLTTRPSTWPNAEAARLSDCEVTTHRPTDDALLSDVTPLRWHDDAVHPAHQPRALGEHDAAEPRSPLLERLAVGSPKRTKLGYRLKEHLPLPASDRKRWVSASKRLEARGPSKGREAPHALGAKHTPAAFFDLLAGKSLLACKFVSDRLAKGVRPVTLFEGGWQCERQLNLVGPLGVVGIEEALRACDDEGSAPQLLGQYRDARPVPGPVDQAGFDRVGHHVGEFLDHGALGQQPNNGAALVVPGGTFPLAEYLGAKGDQSMEASQEVREATLGVGDHQVFMGAHERYAVHQHAKLPSTDRKCVEVELPDGGVGTKEVVTAEGAPSHHDRATGQDETGLSHGCVDTRKARQARRTRFQCFVAAVLADALRTDGGRQPG